MYFQVAPEPPVSPILCSRCRRECPDAVPADPEQVEICQCCEEPCQSDGCCTKAVSEIEELTPEQEAAIEKVLDRWLAYGLSTAPADRSRAERGVRLAYEAAGLLPPHTFLWADSPLQGALLASRLGSTLSFEKDRIESSIVRAEHGPRGSLGGEVWQRLHPSLTSIADEVRWAVFDPVRRAMGDYPGSPHQYSRRPIAGQHDADSLAAFDCCRALGIEIPKGLEGSMLVGRSAWGWWPFSGTAVLSDRPEELHRDEQGRLHAEDGMAIRYRDGWGVWAWHGVPVPQQVIEAPETLVAKEIREEQNVELRRIMIERYGAERYLKDIGAKLVDEDERGRLWRATLPGDEPLAMVEVVNSTPEPDGSFKKYWLRVPPRCRTARGAVAWSFGRRASNYQPAIET